MKISFYFLAVLLLPLSLAAVNSGRVHLHGSVNLNDAKIESGGKGRYLKFPKQPELNGKVVTFDLTAREGVWEFRKISFVPERDGIVSVQFFSLSSKGKQLIYGTFFDNIALNGTLLPNGDLEQGNQGWKIRSYPGGEKFPARITSDRGIVKFGKQCLLTSADSRAVFTISVKGGVPAELTFQHRFAGPLHAGKDVAPVDLRPYANRGFADEKAGDGKGGWSDQGPEEDLHGIDPALVSFGGMEFTLIDPASNGGKSVLTFDSRFCRTSLKEVKIPFRKPYPRQKFFYLLHTSCWTPKKGTAIGSIRFHFADGLNSEYEIVAGRDVLDWIAISGGPNAKKVCEFPVKQNRKGGFFLSRFTLPGKEIAAVTLSTKGNSVWIVGAGSFASREVAIGMNEFKPDATWKVSDFPDLQVVKGSAIDLDRFLAPGPAGKYGRVRFSPGGGLEFEKLPGVEQRFFGFAEWGCDRLFRIGERMKIKRDRGKDVPLFCSLMRRQGYNALRIGVIPDNRKSGDELEYQAKWLDFMDYLVAEGKKQGIYFYVNLDYGSLGKRYWTSQDRLEGRFRFIIGDPLVRNAWKRLAERLLNHVNPYTGIAWKEEPAVLCMEFSNELELGIHYYARLPKELKQGLLERWHAFLERKYGSFAEVKKAWGGQTETKTIGELTEPQQYWVNNQENRDWNEFLFQCLSDLQKWCSLEIRKMGYPGLVTQYNCGKQIRHSGLRAECSDAVSINTYFNHPRGGWGEAGTQYVQNSSIELAVPHFLTASASRLADRPILVTEQNHCYANRYQYENALTFPAYAALQNFGGVFVHQGAVWLDRNPELIYNPPKGPDAFRVYDSPLHRANEFLGACLFGRGDVRKSQNRIELAYNRAYLRDCPPECAVNSEQSKLSLLTGFGLRVTDIPFQSASAFRIRQTPSCLTLAPVGGSQAKMELFFSEVGSADKNTFSLKKTVDYLKARHILPSGNRSNPDARIFESDTGELLLNQGSCSMSVSTPMTEGAAQLAGNTAHFKVLEILSRGVNSTIALTSVDGRKLTESGRMVLAVVTEQAASGMRMTSDRVTVLDPGHFPVLIRTGRFRIGLNLAEGEYRLYPLSVNGIRRAPLPLKREGKRWIAEIDTAALPNGATPFFEIVK